MRLSISKQLRDFRKMSTGLKDAYRGSDGKGRVRHFNEWMDRASSDDAGTSNYNHATTVQEYYDLCTEIMVFGWGESLHFAPLSPEESLEDSKIRHQRMIISKLDLQEGMEVIDVGCGVGGPMRRIASEAGVRVLGVNSSEVQLGKAKSLTAAAGLDQMIEYLACSFMDMSALADETFDRGYAIESTCHAPNKQGAFAEIFRVLKPGALFWGQEMCLTDEFDPDNDRHRKMEKELKKGIALRDIATMGEVNSALEAAGFEVLEGKDLGVVEDGASTPWYEPMAPQGNTLGNALRRTPLGRETIFQITRVIEVFGVFPKGAAEAIRLMDQTANAYVAGGKSGIFTPLYCFLARKPL